tara:strand:+ start:2313 stop:2774 length:462 start_codon:yes stop_codon:yes gene_type:complete
MDISRNQIDLMYLTNRLKMNKVVNIKEKRTILKSEKEKYKNKISQLLNSFMEEDCTYENVMKNELKMMFDDFLLKTIRYYKFQNKENKVQSQYDKTQKKKNKCTKLNLNEIDITIMKKPEKPKNKNLDSFIKKKKKKRKIKKTVMPKKIDYES